MSVVDPTAAAPVSLPSRDRLPKDLPEVESLRVAERREARQLIGTGLGIGALGTASVAAFGATCPFCIVVTPLLVGAGVFKLIKCRR